MARPRGRLWFAVQFGLFLALLAAPLLQRFDAPPVLRALGSATLLAGILVAVAGYRALGARHSPWTAPIDGGEIVTTGVYGRIRHPIYAGWCLGALGFELLTGSLLGVGFALALVVYYDLRAREEERLLRARYPAYVAYQRRAKRFIPGLY
jgi:protein-S-isoprenylcysteine O-methyltransferase Ste14